MGQPDYKQLLTDRTTDFKEAVWDWLTGQSWRSFVMVIVTVLALGAAGYWMIEPTVGLLDAIYMALITMSTVGYGDVTGTDAGKLFTIVYLILGVGVFSLSLSRIAAAMIEGRIQDVLGRRRMQLKINALKDHIVLCGFGRFGQITAQEFAAEGVPVVVLDTSADVIKTAEMHGVLGLIGDATEEESLLRAGIKRARALCCALPSDADNVYAILTARDIRGDVPVTALARDRKAERKLRFAGAANVISPYTIGARQMARQIISPHVAKVVNLASRGAEGRTKVGVYMEEVTLSAGSRLVGLALRDSPIRREFGVMVVAIIDTQGNASFNPGPDYVMKKSDVLVAVGGDEGLTKLERAGGARGAEPEPDPS